MIVCYWCHKPVVWSHLLDTYWCPDCRTEELDVIEEDV